MEKKTLNTDFDAPVKLNSPARDGNEESQVRTYIFTSANENTEGKLSVEEENLNYTDFNVPKQAQTL